MQANCYVYKILEDKIDGRFDLRSQAVVMLAKERPGEHKKVDRKTYIFK